MPRPLTLLLLALACALALQSCKPAPENPYPGAENFGTQLLEKLRSECEDTGGRFGTGGAAGGLVCHRTPADANRQCRKQSDCSTQCLARSGTCAPVAPLFGCNEVLTDQGQRVTLCVD